MASSSIGDEKIFRGRVNPKSKECRYLIVDLTGGAEAASYPVIGFKALADVYKSKKLPNEYKTNKLLLRLMPTGCFSPEFIPCNDVFADECSCRKRVMPKIRITAFFMGVFEVTQKQWELVMGANTNPARYKYDCHPVENVSYDEIRGAIKGKDAPLNMNVDADSFLGRLQAKTGFSFDLPTEWQWEYACRARTKTDFNNGKNYKEGHNSVISNCACYNFTAKNGVYETVGSYNPNKFGLYDMHGNVFEWCLNYWDRLEESIKEGCNPIGAIKGISRVIRGGSWASFADECRSSYRRSLMSKLKGDTIGFRLSCSVLHEGGMLS